MADPLTIAGIFITIAIGLMGVRFAVLRGRILQLQNTAQGLADRTYADFEAMIFQKRRQDRDPEQALNLAAQYFNWRRLLDRLYRFYKKNKRAEGLDLGTLVLSISVIFMGYPSNLEASPIATLHIYFAGYLIAASIWLFGDAIYTVNRMEKRLGIGQPIPSP